jgi:hypothetical protein
LHFAIPTLQFAIAWGNCKLQNTKCKLQIGLCAIELS